MAVDVCECIPGSFYLTRDRESCRSVEDQQPHPRQGPQVLVYPRKMAGGFSGFRGDEGQLAGCREKRLDGYAQPREDLVGSKHRSVIWSAKDGDDAAHADEGSGGLGALIRGLVRGAFNDVS